MEKFYEEYLNILQECHQEILKGLDSLPPAALDWIPGPEMNSVSVLVVHLTGAERYWIGDVVVKEPSGRDRSAEFRVRELGVEALQKRLVENLAHARRVLEGLTLQDLEKPCVSPRDRRTFTKGWALLHALEHSMLHLGHIQLTCQSWRQAQGQAG